MASPTLAAQIDELLARFPQAKWMQWEPFGRHNAREGSRLAFGEYVDAQYAIEKADVVLSLDADFLCTGAGGSRSTRARSRRAAASKATGAQLNRLYAVESSPTNTGTKADHRLPLRASEIEALRARAWRRSSASPARRRATAPAAAATLDRRRSSRICRPRAAAASSSPATGSRRPSTRSRTR